MLQVLARVSVYTFAEESAMQAYKTEAAISKDGTLTLGDLPFAEGEPVEIIILSRVSKTQVAEDGALRGMPVQYHQPFEPVAQNDWELR